MWGRVNKPIVEETEGIKRDIIGKIISIKVGRFKMGDKSE